MISSLLHLVGLRPRVYYTLTNFRGGGPRPPWPPPQYANGIIIINVNMLILNGDPTYNQCGTGGIGTWVQFQVIAHLPSKKPCTDSIREVVGYVWIRTDPHITGTIFARINPRGFHTCTP